MMDDLPCRPADENRGPDGPVVKPRGIEGEEERGPAGDEDRRALPDVDAGTHPGDDERSQQTQTGADEERGCLSLVGKGPWRVSTTARPQPTSVRPVAVSL